MEKGINLKKILKIIIIMVVFLFICVSGYELYMYVRVKTAKIDVTLANDLTLEFNDTKKVSDYITSINGNLVKDYIIDSHTLGKKTITFDFINNDNIKVKYSYDLTVKDTTAPVIWLSSNYSVIKGSEDTLLKDILCGDNYDSSPHCEIVGDYDLNTVGTYPLTFKATDNSKNTTEKEFNLKVYEPKKNSNNKNTTPKVTHTYFKDIVEEYKTDKTKIGIDVSHWQGDIDFNKLKEAGVEFVIIRVGTTDGIKGDYILDKKFKHNIEQANELGIDVGVYFYSYAKTTKDTINDAKWVLKQIKNYDVTLPIAFDWEDFEHFNDYQISFFELTNLADKFIETVEKGGYKGLLYGSKSYLENLWLPTDNDIWLAHYTDNTDYQGSYQFWQLCSDGVVDGINGNVDIDIMYTS